MRAFCVVAYLYNSASCSTKKSNEIKFYIYIYGKDLRGHRVMDRRVVITGMGQLSSFGSDTEEFWKSIQNGESGISELERFDKEEFTTKVAAEIKDFNPADYGIDRKEARRMDKSSQYAIVAADTAIKDAGLNIDEINQNKFGVMVGTGIGGMETLEEQTKVFNEKGPRRVSPFFIPMMIANMATGRLAIRYGAKGYNECIVTACATATNSIGGAFKALKRGDAGIMIAGGCEAAITPLAFAGFCNMQAMTTNPDPKKASRPFDKNRDGFIMGEGAGIVILEALEVAKKRGAKIIAEIVGYGNSNDAFHITAPAAGGEGGARCMQMAIDDAGIKPEEVSYINAHGTSTPHNDKNETAAIKTVFGEYAYKLPVSSTKSMTGHLLGAAGGIETIISALAIRDQILPPTVNYETPDPECDLDYVTEGARKATVNCVLSNSLGFGGHNATIAIKKYID